MSLSIHAQVSLMKVGKEDANEEAHMFLSSEDNDDEMAITIHDEKSELEVTVSVDKNELLEAVARIAGVAFGESIPKQEGL